MGLNGFLDYKKAWIVITSLFVLHPTNLGGSSGTD